MCVTACCIMPAENEEEQDVAEKFASLHIHHEESKISVNDGDGEADKSLTSTKQTDRGASLLVSVATAPVVASPPRSVWRAGESGRRNDRVRRDSPGGRERRGGRGRRGGGRSTSREERKARGGMGRITQRVTSSTAKPLSSAASAPRIAVEATRSHSGAVVTRGRRGASGRPSAQEKESSKAPRTRPTVDRDGDREVNRRDEEWRAGRGRGHGRGRGRGLDNDGSGRIIDVAASRRLIGHALGIRMPPSASGGGCRQGK